MKEKKDVFVHENKRIRDAIICINDNGYQSALVVDDDLHLKGIVTDGDIRRCIIDGRSLDENITEIMNPNPRYVDEGYDRDSAVSLMTRNIFHILPVLDGERRVVDIIHYVDLLKQERYDTPVVIMAGGLGTRLKNKTKNCPKPLLKVGTKPILETIIENFKDQGFYNFYLTVNYRAELIEEYFGDGKKWNVSIKYVREKERMGTAGSLSLLPGGIKYPIIVINGDILTKTDFTKMLSEFKDSNPVATVGVREYREEIPYGVIRIDDEKEIREIQEKPTNSYLVNAGLYILSKEAVDNVPVDTFYDMPSLLDKLIDNDRRVSVYKIEDYWIDIGRLEDFKRAESEFDSFF